MSDSGLIVNFSEMTDDELFKFKENIENGYDELCENRAEELAMLEKNGDFDPYSFLGKKKIKSIVNKYANDDDGFDFLYKELYREFERRQISVDEFERQRLADNIENISDEEFLAREQAKTEKYKKLK